jgi:hypothetical protein
MGEGWKKYCYNPMTARTVVEFLPANALSVVHASAKTSLRASPRLGVDQDSLFASTVSRNVLYIEAIRRIRLPQFSTVGRLAICCFLALLSFCSLAAPPAGSQANMFKNGSFENGLDGWELHATRGAVIEVDKTVTHDGHPSIRISEPEPTADS